MLNLGEFATPLNDIGLEDQGIEVGGLERKIKVFRMPDAPLENRISYEMDIELHQNGDNQIWIAVYTEDGFQAWSSPVYVMAT